MRREQDTSDLQDQVVAWFETDRHRGSLPPEFVGGRACGGGNATNLRRCLTPYLARSLATCFALLLAVLFLSGCGSASRRKPGDKLNVIVTHSILGDLVQNVAGNNVNLVVLVPAGGDAHTFDPKPKDQTHLADADLVFENGLEFETWLDKIYKASRSKAKRIVVTEGIEPLEMDEDDHDHKKDAKGGHAHDKDAKGGHAHAHDHGVDPHVWHDVHHAMHMVRRVRDGLMKADPAHSDAYNANAEKYLKELEDLDAWVVKELAAIPKERRKLVTSHDTFGYFAKRYGFVVTGTALGSLSTEVGDPGAAKIAKLIERIKAEKVPAIFAENIQNPDIVKQVAKGAGVKLGAPLYTDALGEPGSDGDTYVKMIKFDVSKIVEALK